MYSSVAVLQGNLRGVANEWPNLVDTAGVQGLEKV
jgi:hypothetical protein